MANKTAEQHRQEREARRLQLLENESKEFAIAALLPESLEYSKLYPGCGYKADALLGFDAVDSAQVEALQRILPPLPIVRHSKSSVSTIVPAECKDSHESEKTRPVGLFYYHVEERDTSAVWWARLGPYRLRVQASFASPAEIARPVVAYSEKDGSGVVIFRRWELVLAESLLEGDWTSTRYAAGSQTACNVFSVYKYSDDKKGLDAARGVVA